MDSLSMAYLEKFRYVQITRNRESYVVWVLHETREHFVAEQLSACPDGYGEGGYSVESQVFPCCSSASTNVDGEKAFHRARLQSRFINGFESSESIVCYPHKHSPFLSTWPHPRNCDAPIHPQPYAQSVTTVESRPTSRAPELPLENANAILHKQNKKRTSSKKTSQKERAKRPRVTTTKAASLLLTQLSVSAKQSSSDQSALPDDVVITNKLKTYQQLVLSQPENVDSIVEELQLWLQQVQHRSSLYLAALQHLLTCVDLYNWANRCDKNTERRNNKERWSALQMARYRNMIANELCKTKHGVTDCLGLASLAPMTAKGIKFGNLDKASEGDKLEIVQKFAALARPRLEEELKNMRVIEVTNPVRFVCWFLQKPVDELPNICKSLCFTALSVEDCSSSPAIWHKIQRPGISQTLEDSDPDSDGNAQGLNWLLKAAGQCEEVTQGSYEVSVTDQAPFDNGVWGLSDLLESDAHIIGFN